MELRYRREAAVGVFIIVAVLIFVFGMIWLRGKSIRSGEMVETTFSDVAGLKVGDPIRTSGVAVGQIKDIRLLRPGQVLVLMDLKGGQRPRSDARAVVRSLDLFGAQYLDYDPGAAAQPLAAGAVIPGEREQSVAELVSGLTGPGRQALSNAGQFLSPQNAAELHDLLVDTRRAVGQIGAAAQAPSDEAAHALLALRELLQRLDLLVGSSSTQQTVDNLRDATRNLTQMTATLQHTGAALDSILLKVNGGRGSMGRLVNDTTLVSDLHAASVALTALLTDLKANPGRYVNVHVF
ncbi:MAG TPA: MlaD family protein [Gemmatimonadales bacterium]|nr:MlaD family protein [Gemmatimonadales bacterium]